MKILLSIIALMFVVSCAHHKKHDGDHDHSAKAHSCGGDHRAEGHTCGGDHSKGCGGDHKNGKTCGGKGMNHHKKRAEEMLKKMDTNKDGKISKAEFEKGKAEKFNKMDDNKDGFLSNDEMSKCDCKGMDKGKSKSKDKVKK